MQSQSGVQPSNAGLLRAQTVGHIIQQRNTQDCSINVKIAPGHTIANVNVEKTETELRYCRSKTNVKVEKPETELQYRRSKVLNIFCTLNWGLKFQIYIKIKRAKRNGR